MVDNAFWLERWNLGQIGFHQSRVHPLLIRHWASVAAPGQGQVLVPLSGKSLDLGHLRALGHAVTGIELSHQAIVDFFKDRGEDPALEKIPAGTAFCRDEIRLIEADFFDIGQDTLGPVAAVYDRAALIALTPERQVAYVEHLRSLSYPAAILLITLEYDPREMTGPPFAVSSEQVESLFKSHYEVRCLERTDALYENPSLRERGLTRLREVAWRLSALRPAGQPKT